MALTSDNGFHLGQLANVYADPARAAQVAALMDRLDEPDARAHCVVCSSLPQPAVR